MRLSVAGFALITSALGSNALAQTAETSPSATKESAADSQQQVETLKGKLDALEEQYLETKTDVGGLKKLKFSGYVQGRYTDNQSSKSGVVDPKAATPKAAVNDGFSVRRGRLKAAYEASWSKYVLQIDAVPTGLSLKDAEVHLAVPYTKQAFWIVAGQTKWPFGFEVNQSSGDRELPERSRVIRAFLPNERDRGIKLVGKAGVLRLMAGIFDGNGTGNTNFVGVDNDRYKDAIGRVGVDFGFVTAGVSGWYGKTRRPAVVAADGSVTTTSEVFDRNRLGADVQVYLDLLPIGGTALKAEYIQGTTPQSSNVEQFGKKARGWYGLLVQNLFTKYAVAARYDSYDPDTSTGNAIDSKVATKPASNNQINTLAVGAVYYVDESFKASVFYDWVMTGTTGTAKDPSDNVLTVQLQAKF